jgi:hypothetical protein
MYDTEENKGNPCHSLFYQHVLDRVTGISVDRDFFRFDTKAGDGGERGSCD